jgi:DNA-binding beta-propeller fold protein YncE
MVLQNVAMYVADESNHRIQYFGPTGGYLGKWGGHGNGNGQFESPAGGAVTASRVYVADKGNQRIDYFSSTGDYQGQFGAPGSGDG